MGGKLSRRERRRTNKKNKSATPESSRLMMIILDGERCYDPHDPTLTFVDGPDELDFLCSDYKSLRARMSCGHTVTPTSLYEWCSRLLDKDDCRFVCGQPACNVEWPFKEVCKMALLTPEEIESFEKKIFRYAAKNYLDVKQCPGCNSRAMRANLNDLCVECTVCKASGRRTYTFCWQCLREWKGPVPRSDRCDNDGCFNQALETLRKCRVMDFDQVKGVTGCPSIRACPTCGLLMEHKRACKSMVCPRCKMKFCFVCLKLFIECQKITPCSPYKACSTGVAPRQTSIPAWRRK